MKILIINTDYGPFLCDLYGTTPELAQAPYSVQMRRRNETLFGAADFYSRHFIALGHEAREAHANNGPMQRAWLKLRGPDLPRQDPPPAGALMRLARLFVPALRATEEMLHRPSYLRSPIDPTDLDVEGVLLAQVRELRPDIILNQAVSEVESRILHKMRPYTKFIVGQIASPLPDDEPYTAYDMMVSSLPNFVSYYRNRGIPAELNRLAFEPTVLDAMGAIERDVPVSFVGSITSDHARRFELLEQLARDTDIAIWGRVTSVPERSPICARYRGEAWGRDMFRVLGRSTITVNQHIDIAQNYANNMRLFEATGMGALLITDQKDNIVDLFEPGKEVVCYSSADECIDLIRYYREHEAERNAIAAAGQQRTLRDHTYRARVAELIGIFERKLATRPR